MHALSGTKQCDSILLFFCLTKCVCFISSYKDSSGVVFFILRLMKILWKSSVFYLSPSYTLDSHTIAKSCNIFQQIPIFLRLLHLNNASLFSTTNRSKILIIKSMSDIDYCHSNYCHKKQAPMTASFSEGFYFSLKTLEEACCIL